MYSYTPEDKNNNTAKGVKKNTNKKEIKSEFTRGPGRGDTCHLSVFDETLPG